MYFLIDQGVDLRLNLPDNESWAPLHLDLKYGLDMVWLFLEYGIDILHPKFPTLE